MERIRKLVLHPLFQEQAAFLKDAEKDRIFCRHSIEHLLDVARIMYIYNLEDGCGLNRELIYAAALLHDIGRPDQIRYQTPHPAA
ncbi:MAG: HD domain-containing protein, partial [Lachnospiraceae bacterium]|nr:HD domain-containing protein [Lachnospiraceae bacterium]